MNNNIPILRKMEIEYLAILIGKANKGKREFISQAEAFKRFGRENVLRWHKEGSLNKYKRPGKIEYREEDLYKCALNVYDY